jgi:tetratricopeptide (TPR) repeat protein
MNDENRAGTKGIHRFRFALLLVVVTIIAYVPAIRGGFIWDDDVHLKSEPLLQSAHGLKMIWLKPGFTPQYYPLTHTTFWIEANLWGTHPLGYHLVNVLLHACNALLLWRVLRVLEIPGAFLAASIFALHPVHVESVAWVTERKNVLSGLFCLSALLCYVRFIHHAGAERTRAAPDPVALGKSGAARVRSVPAWWWYIAALVLFIGAVLSKTVSATLPAALLLILVWKQRRVTLVQFVTLIPMFVVALIMGRLTATMEQEHVGALGAEWNYTLAERLLIAGRAVWFYLRTLLCPVDLMFFYPKWSIDPANLIAWLFPLAVLIAIAALALSRKRLGSGPLVAMLFFLGTLFPALGFVNVYPMRYSFVADHFQYLASIGIITLIAAMLARWEKYALVLPLLLAALTFHRASAFNNPEALWNDTVAKNPQAWAAHDQLGYIYVGRNDPQQAKACFERAIQINPDHPEGYIGLGNLLLGQNQPDDAVVQMRRAVAVQPDGWLPNYGLGVALLRAGDARAAVVAFAQAVRVKPNHPRTWEVLADAYNRLGESDKAIECRRTAQRLAREAFGYDAQP